MSIAESLGVAEFTALASFKTMARRCCSQRGTRSVSNAITRCSRRRYGGRRGCKKLLPCLTVSSVLAPLIFTGCRRSSDLYTYPVSRDRNSGLPRPVSTWAGPLARRNRALSAYHCLRRDRHTKRNTCSRRTSIRAHPCVCGRQGSLVCWLVFAQSTRNRMSLRFRTPRSN